MCIGLYSLIGISNSEIYISPEGYIFVCNVVCVMIVSVGSLLTACSSLVCTLILSL